jgi:hypothetical protein
MAKKSKASKKKNKKGYKPDDQKVTRNHKATMFSSLLGTPEAEAEVYSALTGIPLPPETKVKDVTLQGILFRGRMNDLAFIVDDLLVIVAEHQSTINPNIPLRFLSYMADIYNILVDEKARLSSRQAEIPYPEFVVLYNGKDTFPECKTYTLSSAFKNASNLLGELKTNNSLEVTVNVYNINKGFNTDLIARSTLLSGYVTFHDKMRTYLDSGDPLSEAMNKTIAECISENILKEYLEHHGAEVRDMLSKEWDQNLADEVLRRESFEDGFNNGFNSRDAEVAELKAQLSKYEQSNK